MLVVTRSPASSRRRRRTASVRIRRRERFEEIRSEIRRLRGSRARIDCAFFVPGRIEVVGKHTDYAGGRSLTAATNRGFLIAGARRSDGRLRVIDLVRGQARVLEPGDGPDAHHGDWGLYPAVVWSRFRADIDPDPVGGDLVFASDLPSAAGLSSSSALVTIVFLALCGLQKQPPEIVSKGLGTTRFDLAGYLAAVEAGRSVSGSEKHPGVGTDGGAQDHTAILCSRAGELGQYSFRPIRHERSLPMPSGWSFVIGVSGVAARKSGSVQDHYNLAARRVRELERMTNRIGGGADETLAAALARRPELAVKVRDHLAAAGLTNQERRGLEDRLEHFLLENDEIVPGVGSALAEADLASFGDWVDRSQAAGHRLLRNQVPETLWLAERARDWGAVAATAFGAGFGGAVWAMVSSDGAESFRDRWGAGYRDAFPEHASRSAFFVTDAEGPASEL